MTGRVHIDGKWLLEGVSVRATFLGRPEQLYARLIRMQADMDRLTQDRGNTTLRP